MTIDDRVRLADDVDDEFSTQRFSQLFQIAATNSVATNRENVHTRRP